VCGNHIIEPGETCTNCSTDCQILTCNPGTPVHTFSVNFDRPAGNDVNTATVLVGYRSDHTSIPGSGNASSVTARVKNRPSNAIVSINDLDYALRVLISRSSPIPPGRLFTVDFDPCTGKPTPTLADFACTVLECLNGFGSVDGCTCNVGP